MRFHAVILTIATMGLTACGGGNQITGKNSGALRQEAAPLQVDPSDPPVTRSFWVDSKRGLLLDLVKRSALPPQSEETANGIPESAETWEANFQYGADGCRAYVSFWSDSSATAVTAKTASKSFVEISQPVAFTVSSDPNVDRAPRNCEFLVGRYLLRERSASRLRFCLVSPSVATTAVVESCYDFHPVAIGPAAL